MNMRKMVAIVVLLCLILQCLPAIPVNAEGETLSTQQSQIEPEEQLTAQDSQEEEMASLYIRLLGADHYDLSGNAYYNIPAVSGMSLTVGSATGVDGTLASNGNLTYLWQLWDASAGDYIDLNEQTAITYTGTVTNEMLQTENVLRCEITSLLGSEQLTRYVYYHFTETTAVFENGEDVVTALRQQMTERQRYSVAACPAELAPDVADLGLLDHTGNPKEGDYLSNLTRYWSVSTSSVQLDGQAYTVFTVTATYLTTAEQERIMDSAVAEVLPLLDTTDSYSTVYSIYNYIADHVTYDNAHYDDLMDHFGYLTKQTAYGALIDGSAVCEGIAQLFYRLCLEMGVDARVITGSASIGLHAWNIADVDGNGVYYLFDNTLGVAYAGRRLAYDEDPSYFPDSQFVTDDFNAQFPMDPEHYSCGRLDYTVEDTTLTIHANIPDFYGDFNLRTWYWDGFSVDAIETILVDEGVTKLGNQAFNGFTALKRVQLPQTLERIGDEAFMECSQLSQINFPDSLVSIGDRVFINCYNLPSFILPDNVEAIGEDAFANCRDMLTQITILPTSKLKYLGEGAFSYTGITSAYLPEGIQEVPAYLFQCCRNLESVQFAGEITAIGEGAFERCNFQSFTIPESVARIEERTFYACEALVSISIPDTVTYIGSYAFYYCSNLTGLSLPENISYLGDHAFLYCNKLSGVMDIPESLIYIGDGAFATVPITQFAVAEGNPEYCDVEGVLFNQEKTELLAFPQNYFGGETGSYVVPDGVQYICSRAFERQFDLQQITLPEGLLEIGYRAFADCSSLQTMEIPDSVTSIDDYAFAYCRALQTIAMPASLSYLGIEAFYYCIHLSRVSIPDSLETIGYGAFLDCEALQVVDLPVSLKEITSRAFYDCTALTTVNYAGSSKQWADITVGDGNTYLTDATFVFGTEDTAESDSVTVTFDGNGGEVSAASCTLQICDPYGELPLPERDGYTFTGWVTDPVHGALVTADAVVALKEDHTLYALWEPVTACGSFGEGFTWILYTDGFLVISGVGDLPASNIPWYDQQNIQSVKVTGGITGIGKNAFYGKETITRVEIGDGVTTIGKQAFWGCTALSELQLPNSILRIEEGAFNSCEALEEITLPKKLQHIGDYAFRGTGLKGVYFPEGLQEIGSLAFTYCDNLTEVTLPSSLKNLYNSAFRECTGLQSVTFLRAPDFIGHAVFRDCTALQTLNLPNGMQKISADMFYSCTALQNIVLPVSITEIGNYAFSHASNLESVTMSGVNTIGSCAFFGCTTLKTVNASNALQRVGSGAFMHCVNLQKAVITGSTSALGSSAFGGCISLTEVVLTGSCIGAERAFADCTALESVQFTSYSATVPLQMFAGCTSLRTLQFSQTLQTVEQGAFSNCGQLTTVYWPGTQAQWETVEIQADNDALLNARVICTDTDETVVTVTLDASGGTVTPEVVEVLYGGVYGELPQPEKENAVFLGWFTAAAGGVQVLADTPVNTLQTHALYARWTEALASGQCGESMYWSLYENGQLHIIGTGAMWELTTYPWEEIKQQITALCIHEGVESIATSAFINCDSLENIQFATTVQSIGANAFEGCDALITLMIPETVTQIGDKAFYNCQVLHEATVSATGTYMFYNCPNLTTVYITGEADTIADYAFYVCRGLQQVTIGDGVISVGNLAFNECCYIEQIQLPDTLLYIGNYAFANIYDWDEIILPEGLQTIGSYAFRSCWAQKISVPGSVVNIGENAFYGCSYLTEVRLGEGITELSEGMFAYCYQLPEIQLPNSLKVIGKGAFCGCEALHEISIPDGVTTINPGAFSASGLTSIEIPGSVQSLSGFYGCISLESVILHEGIATLDCQAFAYCPALRSITIPASVQTICVQAFADSTALQEIIFLGDLPEFNTQHSWYWGDNAYTGITATVYYPQGNETWTAEQMVDHGGTITYLPWATLGNSQACSHVLSETETTTCTQRNVLYTCDCGYTYMTREALEGSHTWIEATCTTPKICTVCDETEGEPLGHNYECFLCTNCEHFDEQAFVEAADLNDDGKISAFDAQILAEANAGLRTLTEEQKKALGNISVKDILDYILGRYPGA